MRTSKKIYVEPGARDTTKYAAVFEKKNMEKKFSWVPQVKFWAPIFFFYLTIDYSQTGKLLIVIKR